MKGRVNQQNTSSQNFGNSSIDQFSKQLGKHGFLKHTQKGDPGFNSHYTNNSYNVNEDSVNSTKQAQEPYKREAGRSLMKGSSHNKLSNSLGEKNISRRIVENNILLNQSVERPHEQSLREEQPNSNTSLKNQAPNSLDQRFENFYQNQSNKQMPWNTNKEHYGEGIEGRNRKEYNHQKEQLKPEHEFYPQQEQEKEHYPAPEQQEINESLDQEIARTQHQQPKEQSLHPSNSANFDLYKQNIKYKAPEGRKSVQFDQNPQVQEFKGHVSDTNSRMGDQRTQQVFADVGKSLIL